MRRKILTFFGMLLVATSAGQMEIADARSVRKVTRAPHPATQQFRDGWSPSGVQSDRPKHREHPGVSASTAGEGKSCDVLWCY